MIVVLGAARAATTSPGAHAVTIPASLKTASVDASVDVHSRAGETRTEIVQFAFSDRYFFTRLAALLACSNDWFAALGGLLGNGDAFSRVVTVANTCQPGHGLYELGKWIAGNSPERQNQRHGSFNK
jgi:hypothetical protein